MTTREEIERNLSGALHDGYGLAAKMADDMADRMQAGLLPDMSGPRALRTLAEMIRKAIASDQ